MLQAACVFVAVLCVLHSVNHPSVWPPVTQVPDVDRRAKPWGAYSEVAPNGSTVVVPGVPFLITAASSSVAGEISDTLNASGQRTMWCCSIDFLDVQAALVHCAYVDQSCFVGGLSACISRHVAGTIQVSLQSSLMLPSHARH